MDFGKKKVGTICVICDAAVLAATQPHADCHPVVLKIGATACPPPVLHLPDNPHRERTPLQFGTKMVATTSSASDTGDLGQLFWRRRAKAGLLAVGSVALAGTGMMTELGKSLVAVPAELARDLIKTSGSPVPTLGSEVRVVAPEGILFKDVYITRPITGTHIEIRGIEKK